MKVFIDGYKNVRSRKEMLGLSSNKMKIQSEIILKNKNHKYSKELGFFLNFCMVAIFDT